MLPWERKFDAKCLLMVLTEIFFGVQHSLCASAHNLTLKTLIWIWWTFNWWIESVTMETRLTVENQLLQKTACSKQVALGKMNINALKKEGILTKQRHSKSSLLKE